MSQSIPSAVNLAVLVGTLRRDPEVRPLPSGEEVLSFEVTVRSEVGAAESVPVSWIGAPATASTWTAGDQLLVTGRTRRRFFRSGGATQSRTEVVAEAVVPTRRAATVRRQIAAAVTRLEEVLHDGP